MITPHVRLSQSAEYRENYILQDSILWYQFCNVEVDHKRKDTLDKHLHTIKYLKNKNTGNNFTLLIQRTILLFENTLNKREKINMEVVETFTFADILLEKVEKLKPFLLKHCKNGMNFLFFIYNFMMFYY